MEYKWLLLLFLLFPPFASADSGGFKLNGKPVPAVVAKVNGAPVRSARLESGLISFRLRARAQGRKIAPPEEALAVREVLKAEITKELVAQKARSLNIKISPEKIGREIQNIEGKFPGRSALLAALAFQRMSMEALKKKIEWALLEDELIRLEIAPKVKLSGGAAKEFYNRNREKFSKPALYRTRHILIATVETPKKLEDEADRKKALRMAGTINGEAESKAREVLRKIRAGGDFIRLAQQYSEDEASRQKGGMLGDLHPDSTIPEIAAEMVKLREGQTSGVIQSAFGYHILRLDEIIPSALTPFEEAESRILNILMKGETENLFKKYIADLEKNAKIEIFI